VEIFSIYISEVYIPEVSKFLQYTTEFESISSLQINSTGYLQLLYEALKLIRKLLQKIFTTKLLHIYTAKF